MLSGKQRRYLRGLGHALRPVVQLGKDGIDDGVVAAIDRALTDHELIKLKIGESAEVVFGELALGSANLTTRVRLDSITGAILHQKTTTVSTQGTLRQNVNITRRPDVGGNQIYEVISESDAATVDVVSFPPGFDHTLVLTGVWSAAATGNTTTAKLAQLRKL